MVRKNTKFIRSSFTLVEIMVVMAILAILMAIAIPILKPSKKTANNNATKASLRLIASALEIFKIDNSSYPTSLETLANLNYLSDGTCGTNSGYTYNCDNMDANGYTIYANATACSITGSKNYWVTTGVQIHESDCT